MDQHRLYDQTPKDALPNTEQDLSRMVQNVPGIVFRCRVDKAWTMEFMSDEVETLTGYLVNEFIHNKERSFESIMHPEDRKQVRNHIDKAILSCSLYEVEYRILTQDGEIKWVHERGQSISGNEDGIVRLGGVIIDITRQKIAEQESQRKASLIASLIDTIPDIIFFKDLEGVYLECNTEFCRYIGKTKEDVIGKSDYELCPKNEADSFHEKDEQILRGGQSMSFEELVTYPDGRSVLLEVLKTPFRDIDGNVIGVLGISRDVTERQRAQEVIQQANDRLLTVLNSIDASIYIANMETHQLLFVNKHARKTWKKEYLGKKCWEVLQVNQQGPCAFCTNTKLLTQDKQPSGVYQWEFQNTVNAKWYECRDTAIRWTDGCLVRMEIATDITERKQMEDRLMYDAMHDSLTGINNRRAILNALHAELARAVRVKSGVCVAMIDLDHFKRINDTYGHAIGDKVLIHFVEHVKLSLRPYDHIGRMGGDEFLIVASFPDAKVGEAFMNRICQQIRNTPIETAVGAILLTVSIGVTWSCGNETVDNLLSLADKWLYEAKDRGRNRIVCRIEK